jgi:hypothetical protein
MGAAQARQSNVAVDCFYNPERHLHAAVVQNAVDVIQQRLREFFERLQPLPTKLVECPDCGVKVEKVPLLPSKAPFSKRFEDAVGLACESAAARQVSRQFGLAASTVRAIDLRYLERWAATRRMPPLRQMGVDEIHMGKKQKFLTVVCKTTGSVVASFLCPGSPIDSARASVCLSPAL